MQNEDRPVHRIFPAECFFLSALCEAPRELRIVQIEAKGRAVRSLCRPVADDFRRIDFGGGAFKILTTPGVTALLYESLVGMIFRQVFTDGRALPAVDEPTWLGYSVGRWDGDTLVVDSTGFKDGGWLDTLKGRPSSDALRVTERFRRTDFGHMDLVVTIADPKAYLKPWTITAPLHLLPDTELLEVFCDGHEHTMEHRRITPAPPEPHSP